MESNIAQLPPDDLNRQLAHTNSAGAEHVGIVGDTYTILLSGRDTAGRYCLIDMYVPQGGGPGPHRHDFEETFTLLEGELDVTFRGAKQKIKGGETIHIPANAPHQFHNSSANPVRMFCICAPAGQEDFFRQLGTVVETRTTPPPALDAAQFAAFREKAGALAPKFRTELLKR
jgi:quercetin dioxygenase-like cupin family protein